MIFRPKLSEVVETSGKVEEVYIPVSPIEIAQPFETIEPTTKKHIRYFNTLNELRLIVIDGPKKKTLKFSNISGELTSRMQNVQASGPKTMPKTMTPPRPCPLKISAEEKSRWKENSIER